MKYNLFFTGLCSTPFTVGVKDENNIVVEEIDVSRPSGKETRKVYQKALKELKKRYKTSD